MFEPNHCDECWCDRDCSEQDNRGAFSPKCDSSRALNVEKFSEFISKTVVKNTYQSMSGQNIDWREIALTILKALSERQI